MVDLLAGDPNPYAALQALNQLDYLLLMEGQAEGSPNSLNVEPSARPVLVVRRVGRVLLKNRAMMEGLLGFIVRHGSVRPNTDLGWVANEVSIL